VTPEDLGQLFDFYYQYVKPLYSSVQLENEIPSEVLFELNAALDHISRIYKYNDPPENSCEKAYGHFKRACLDMYKIKLRDHTVQWKDLLTIDVSLIDNGQFEGKMKRARAAIKEKAAQARNEEGDPSAGFEHWTEVYEACANFERDFFENPGVTWVRQVKKKSLLAWGKEQVWGIALGMVVAIAGSAAYDALKPLWTKPETKSSQTNPIHIPNAHLPIQSK
jgi:hypothetical protein